MKQGTHRNWPSSNPPRRNWFSFDYTLALGSLATAVLVYIIYHVYPLISQGILW